jgi:stress-induced morphogen
LSKIVGGIPSIQYIQIDDNSDGLCDGGAKLVITVVSESFNDTTALQRHRKIQTILKHNDLMSSIHALTLNTWTPTQYEAKKSTKLP